VTRPSRLVVVLGTATEVGKTWVSCRLAAHLRAGGCTVAARKPAQSFGPAEEGRTDADLLAAATGEQPVSVCPAHRWYPLPLAPPMAAERLDRPPIALEALVAELAWPDGTDVGVVEAAGGVRSPLAHDGDGLALVEVLRPDLTVVVADAGLGTIGAVRSALDALPGPATALLNRFSPDADLHQANLRWLTERDGHDVVVDVEALATRVLG
jgi:dethiobiotin synthetase